MRMDSCTEDDQMRAAVFANYVRPFLRTDWNGDRHLFVHEIATYSPVSREMPGHEADRPY